MQLLQGILCFIDINLGQNIKNNIFLKKNEIFFFTSFDKAYDSVKKPYVRIAVELIST